MLLYADFGDYTRGGRYERVYTVSWLCSAAGPGINDRFGFCFVYKMEEIITPGLMCLAEIYPVQGGWNNGGQPVE